MTEQEMMSNKPYLIRAIHEWIWDNDCTPYLYINTEISGLRLPEHLFADNPLILNVSPNACKDLELANDAITFQARFSGQVFDVYLPIESVIAIVARENGQGMSFDLSPLSDSASDTEDITLSESPPTEELHKKSGLKIIR